MVLWSESEINFLKKHYSSESKKEIQKTIKRSWKAIILKAGFLGLNRRNCISKNNLRKLSLETLESYYWIGFLFADGHFNKKGQLKLSLQKKDFDHLNKFANYIECNIREYKNCFEVTAMDKEFIEQFSKKYSITSNKTKNPPILPDLNNSFIIGLIDGDGYINKNNQFIAIKMHHSWFENLILIKNWFNEYNCSVMINNQGYAYLYLPKKVYLILKEYINQNNIPHLERKWCK